MRKGQKVTITGLNFKGKPFRPMKHMTGATGKLIEKLPVADEYDFVIKVNNILINVKKDEIE